jgi:hypothetical protein
MTQVTERQAELPLAGRMMELRGFERASPSAEAGAPLAKAHLVFAAGAAVRRYDWWRERMYDEVLVVDPQSIRLDRLKRGAPLLNTHNSWSLEAQLGVVENPTIERGQGECDVTFSRRPSVAGYVQDVDDRIIRNVSVGYVRHRVEMSPPGPEGGVWTYRVVDWEPLEVSLVPIPADMDAQVRSASGQQPRDPQGREVRTFPCEFTEVRSTPTAGKAAAQPSEDTMNEAELKAKREQEAAEAATRAAAEKAAAEAAARAATEKAAVEAAAVQRSAEITELCVRHGVQDLAGKLIRSGKTTEQVQKDVLDELARRDAAAGGHLNAGGIRTMSDEHQVRLQGMEEAVLSRVDPRHKLTDNGRQYRGMSLLELGRDYLEFRGVSTRGMDRLRLATEVLQFRSGGMMVTSDFASLLANVANKRLRNGYDENNASYQVWARRAPNAPDFKTMTVVQLSAAPDLLKVNEHGEFKVGSLSDGKETYSLLTYGRIVPFSRQAIINDDLRGFDRLIGGFGNSAKRLENRTVYAIMTANANLSDGGALFNTTAVTTAGGHANLAGAGAGSALQESSLITARTAMRKQVGLQREELNVAPKTLIVPAALETAAYKLTSPNFVPATSSAINEFARGGRTALEVVVEAVLDGNSATAWYLAADSAQIDTVEYCYLDGADGPVIESEVGFEIDGISYKCRHDFAAKAIDFRGLYKSPGA